MSPLYFSPIRLASLTLLITGGLIGQLPAQTTAAQYITQGRTQLTKQTSQGLVNANTAFANALSVAPSNPQALILKACTHLALLIQQPACSTLLSQVGATQPNQNAYTFDLQLPIGVNGRTQVAPDAQMSTVRTYFTSVLRPALLDALSMLGKIPPSIPSRSNILDLTGEETSTTPTSIDYGDVLTLKAIIRLVLAAGYNNDTLNLQIALQDLIDLSDGYTTMQDVLAKYPSFVASGSSVSARAEAKKHLIAGLRDLGDAYSFAIDPRRSNPNQPPYGYSHLVMLNPSSPRELANARASLAQIRALAASVSRPTKIPANRLAPNPLLDNQTLFLGALFNAGTSPRAWFGNSSFYGNSLVTGSLKDPSLSGLLNPTKGASLLAGILSGLGDTISPTSQTITFTPPVSAPFSSKGSLTLSASGGASGQPVVFTSPSKNVSISGNTMTLLGPGLVKITATQAGYVPSWQVGTPPYAPASPVTRSMVVTKGTPQITLIVVDTVAYSSGLSVAVSASSTSGKNPSIVSSNPKVAVVQRNGSLLITGPGTTVIKASVPASANFNAASTTKTISVTP